MENGTGIYINVELTFSSNTLPHCPNTQKQITNNNMYSLLVVICVLQIVKAGKLDQGEPTCLSRFDYDYKMLTKMVDLETEQKLFKESIDGQLKLLSDKLHDYLERITRLEEDQRTQTNLLTGKCLPIFIRKESQRLRFLPCIDTWFYPSVYLRKLFWLFKDSSKNKRCPVFFSPVQRQFHCVFYPAKY